MNGGKGCCMYGDAILNQADFLRSAFSAPNIWKAPDVKLPNNPPHQYEQLSLSTTVLAHVGHSSSLDFILLPIYSEFTFLPNTYRHDSEAVDVDVDDARMSDRLPGRSPNAS